jgi:hypothetical protein
MRVTEVTSFHRVSAFMFFEVFKRPPTHYVTTFANLGYLDVFALPALPLLLELPKYATS